MPCELSAMMEIRYIPISPLLDDSVKEGVPSVQVGVEPSTEAGGVHVRVRPVPVAPEPKPDVDELDSTLRDDLLSGRDSSLMSDMLQKHVLQLLEHTSQL